MVVAAGDLDDVLEPVDAGDGALDFDFGGETEDALVVLGDWLAGEEEVEHVQKMEDVL